jgi:hypothetical protein
LSQNPAREVVPLRLTITYSSYDLYKELTECFAGLAGGQNNNLFSITNIVLFSRGKENIFESTFFVIFL